MPTIAIIAVPGTLPEGWEGTPQQFWEYIFENATFSADGGVLAGQIGGARPTSNVGLFVNGTRLEAWDNDKYVSIDTVPIGAMIPFAGSGVSAPADYLFCDGQLVLKADYPKLYAAIGDAWKLASDADPTRFRLPDAQGRHLLGRGAGDYHDQANGKITERSVGQYVGFEWPQHKTPTQASAPTGRYYYAPYGGKPYNGKFYTGITPPSLVVAWMIRAK